MGLDCRRLTSPARSSICLGRNLVIHFGIMWTTKPDIFHANYKYQVHPLIKAHAHARRHAHIRQAQACGAKWDLQANERVLFMIDWAIRTQVLAHSKRCCISSWLPSQQLLSCCTIIYKINCCHFRALFSNFPTCQR